MAQHRAFGLAGGARGVQHEGGLLGVDGNGVNERAKRLPLARNSSHGVAEGAGLLSFSRAAFSG